KPSASRWWRAPRPLKPAQRQPRLEAQPGKLQARQLVPPARRQVPQPPVLPSQEQWRAWQPS
ncbi:MAG: hypothetical protein ACYC6M_01555, partial [Terriglobales bacterium]